MCTSQQLRAARRLLGWTASQTSRRAGLPLSVVEAAERGDGAPDITLANLVPLLRTYEAAGLRFGTDGSVTFSLSVVDP